MELGNICTRSSVSGHLEVCVIFLRFWETIDCAMVSQKISIVIRKYDCSVLLAYSPCVRVAWCVASSVIRLTPVVHAAPNAVINSHR